jgi:fructoselysine-6-P-deglycase FrlB-like protein
MSASTRPSGLSLLESEMSRQHSDALTSFEHGRNIASRVAESLGRTGRLLLVGMGGSHHVNRTVEPAYRARGIDATALIA